MVRWIVSAAFLIAFLAAPQIWAEDAVQVCDVFELTMTAAQVSDRPYVDAIPAGGEHHVRVTFSGVTGRAEGRSYKVAGFWDGGDIFRTRFAPPAPGTWSYQSESSDVGLNGVTDTFVCAEWTDEQKEANPVRRGFVQVCRTGPRPGRYFEYDDGTPFLWIGDTWWLWCKKDVHLESFKTVVDDRAAKGFTVGQLFVPGRRILNRQFTEPDLEHLRKMEQMIRYANSKGITVWVHACWSRQDMDKRVGAENINRWWRYLVARLGAYNVIWTLAGEYNMHNYGGLGLDYWKKLGTIVDVEDPYERLIGVHPTPPAWPGGADAPQWSTGEVLHSQQWLSYNQSQVGHGKWRNEMIPLVVAADYERTPAKPIVVTEPWYEFVQGNPSAMNIRFGAWSAILSGAAGHSYAGGHVWKAHVPESPQRQDAWPMDLSFGTNTLDYPGAVSMGYMSKFLQSIEWWRLEPHPELVSETPAPFCSAVPGREYLIYLRYGGAVKVDLRPSNNDDTFAYRWIDLTRSQEADSGDVGGGTVGLLEPPEDYPGVAQYKDWLVHVVKR
jgi:hypothetical protein